MYKGHNPIEMTFMQWSQKGIIGHFRKEVQTKVKISSDEPHKITVKEYDKRAWVITVSSKSIFEDFKALSKQYSAPIVPKVNNAIDIAGTDF